MQLLSSSGTATASIAARDGDASHAGSAFTSGDGSDLTAMRVAATCTGDRMAASVTGTFILASSSMTGLAATSLSSRVGPSSRAITADALNDPCSASDVTSSILGSSPTAVGWSASPRAGGTGSLNMVSAKVSASIGTAPASTDGAGSPGVMVPTASIETGLAASSAVGPSACAGAMGEAIEAMIHDCTPLW